MLLLSNALDLFYASMEGVLSPATVLFYTNRLPSLLDHLGDIPVDTITLDYLRAWRSSLARRNTRWGGDGSRPKEEGGLSPYTLHQYVRCCKRFFHWLADDGKIPSNPAKRLELPSLPKPYRRGIPLQARDAILDAARASGARDYAICLILADTACRVGGLAGLRMCDLDLEHHRAVVREKGAGETKARPIFFTQGTVDAVMAYLQDRPLVKHTYVFCGIRGGRLTTNGIYQMLERLAMCAGVAEGWNPHNWRHGAIRAMLTAGMSLPAVSQIAGHTSVKTTGDMYGVFSEEELADMHDRYSWTS